MKTGVYVSDIMTIKPIVAKPSTTISECAKMMAENHVGSIVVQENFKATGIITEQDIVRSVIGVGKDPNKTPVSQVMATKLITVKPTEDVFDAMELIKNHNIRHLPVVEKGKMVGFVTSKDILKFQPQLFEILAETIETREDKAIRVNPDAGICGECNEFSDYLYDVNGMMVCFDCKTTLSAKKPKIELKKKK